MCYEVTTYVTTRPSVAALAARLRCGALLAASGPAAPAVSDARAGELVADALCSPLRAAEALAQVGRFVLVRYTQAQRRDPELVVCVDEWPAFDRALRFLDYARGQVWLEPQEWRAAVLAQAARFVPLLYQMQATAAEADFVLGWLRALATWGR
jgi:hypothetical protein